MELTPAQLADLRLVVEDLGDTLYTDHSGKGMFGRTCVGIVTYSNPFGQMLQLGGILTVNGSNLVDDLAELRIEQDSMGLGTILYWPSVTVAD